jgi:hypothetical protein
MSPDSNTTHRAPPNQPKREENVYEEVPMQTFAHVLRAMSHGSSTSHRPLPIPPTEEEHIIDDVRIQTAHNNVSVMSPDRSTSQRAPPITPKGERRDENVWLQTARNNLSSNAARAEEGETYAVYDLTIPGRFQ